MLKRYSAFRRRQREALRASNARRPVAQAGNDEATPADATTADPTTADPTPADPTPANATPAAAPATAPQNETLPILTDSLPVATTAPGVVEPGGHRSYGLAGRPLNRQSPFYVGFVGALGVFVAYGLYRMLGQLTQVITLLVVAFFLTLTLNPLVEALGRRGLRRSLSVTIVFAGLVALFTALGFLVVPPVAQQSGLLADNAPQFLEDLRRNRLVENLDSQFNVITRIQTELGKQVSDSGFVTGIFGGVLGASKALASGFFGVFTVLVLTLYFLASLPKVKSAAYGLVPSSRRPRFESLSEEIMRRVGSYAIGQAAVATINAVASYIMMTIVGIRYAAVLAVVVGVLGLIPMVGASLGAAVVCLVALFDEPQKAAIALVYYVIYQQIENYVVAPRIMQRTIAVPGAVTVVAALVGATLAGVLGALLAMPVAAGLLLIYDEVVVPRQRTT